MSLRLMMYGWSISEFRKVLGSGNARVLQRASEICKESIEEPEYSIAIAWLGTLINKGCPLAADRRPPTAEPDGSLLTSYLESETHIYAMDCLIKAIALPNHLNLSKGSIYWKYQNMNALFEELNGCGFLFSKHSPKFFPKWMQQVLYGTPLFGDNFKTQWAFYSVFTNQELADNLPVLRNALNYERPMDNQPEREGPTSLTEPCKEFTAHFIDSLKQVQETGQDAFFIWY